MVAKIIKSRLLCRRLHCRASCLPWVKFLRLLFYIWIQLGNWNNSLVLTVMSFTLKFKVWINRKQNLSKIKNGRNMKNVSQCLIDNKKLWVYNSPNIFLYSHALILIGAIHTQSHQFIINQKSYRHTRFWRNKKIFR